MKKFFLALGALAIVGAGAYGATTAFFTDQEASVGNTFAAGEIDIAFAGLSHNYQGDTSTTNQPEFTQNGFTFDLADLKPLDEGEVEYGLSNDANDAYVCAMVEENGNAENVRLDQEQDAGDNTAGNPGNGNGELQNYMSFAFANDSGNLSDISGQWYDAGDVNNGQTASSSVSYCFGDYDGSGNCVLHSSGDDNRAQTDSMGVDVTFQAVQKRNNPDFTCEQLNEEDGNGDRPFVGANLDGYEAPANENTTVAEGGSIQDAIDDASPNETILVEDGNYTENVTVNVEGLTIAAANQGGATIDGNVRAAADGVTIEGFNLETLRVLQGASGSRGPDDVSVRYNTFTSSTNGSGNALVTQAGEVKNLTVEHNTFDGYNIGAVLEGKTNNSSVTFNDFTNNNIAFAEYAENGGSEAVSEGNSFTRNDLSGNTKVDVASGDDVVINTNNIADADIENFEVGGSATLDAEDNFWGATNGQDSIAAGDVDVDPEESSAYPSN